MCVCVSCFHSGNLKKMMKYKSRCHHLPPYETVWAKPTTGSRSLQSRRADNRLRSGRTRPSQHQHPGGICPAKRTKAKVRTFVIHSQEIRSFFSLCGKSNQINKPKKPKYVSPEKPLNSFQGVLCNTGFWLQTTSLSGTFCWKILVVKWLTR